MAAGCTKEDAIRIVTACAKKYRDELDGNTLMFVCIDKHNTISCFEFSDDGTTVMKLTVLPSVINKNLSAKMIGDYNSSKPRLYTEKVAGSTNACMGFKKDAATGVFVPNTVLREDLRSNVCSYVRVIAAYRKKQSEEKYRELTYAAKKFDWRKIKLPAPFEYILPENN